jgi:hypothetical protein
MRPGSRRLTSSGRRGQPGLGQGDVPARPIFPVSGKRIGERRRVPVDEPVRGASATAVGRQRPPSRGRSHRRRDTGRGRRIAQPGGPWVVTGPAWGRGRSWGRSGRGSCHRTGVTRGGPSPCRPRIHCRRRRRNVSDPALAGDVAIPARPSGGGGRCRPGGRSLLRVRYRRRHSGQESNGTAQRQGAGPRPPVNAKIHLNFSSRRLLRPAPLRSPFNYYRQILVDKVCRVRLSTFPVVSQAD